MDKEEQLSDLRNAYKRLNKSFKPVLVFHVGESAGFFSEYNCMILAMLYCLQHRIQFKLYSKDANFGYDQGWTDFFESFCEEENSKCHHWINMRPVVSWNSFYKMKYSLLRWQLKKSIYMLLAKCWKLFNPKIYLTQDVWANLFKMKGVQYNVPELGIKGDVVQACNILVQITWMFREDIRTSILDHISKLNITEPFLSCQIRAGDKYIETPLLPVDIYLSILKKHLGIRNVFVLTDDYSIVKKLKSDYKQWNWYTLCKPEEHGYVHSFFRMASKDIKKDQLINLFTAMEIIHQSEMFFGTVTSNPSVFSAIRDPDKTECVDYKENPLLFYV